MGGHLRWEELRERFRDKKAKPEELKKKFEEWHASRDERRREHQHGLMAHWGPAVAKPDVMAELKTHARRLAWISRMEEIAATEKSGDDRQHRLDRLEKMREHENKRHDRVMQQATTSAGAAASAAPASSVAPAAAPPPAPAASGGTP
jgi:hypothetical protein